MKAKRALALLLVAALLTSSALAGDEGINNVEDTGRGDPTTEINGSANEVIIIGVEDKGSTVSGSQTSNTVTDTRTEEEKKSDEAAAEMQEKLDELLNAIENATQDEHIIIDIPGKPGYTLPPQPDRTHFPDSTLDPGTLPSPTLPIGVPPGANPGFDLSGLWDKQTDYEEIINKFPGIVIPSPSPSPTPTATATPSSEPSPSPTADSENTQSSPPPTNEHTAIGKSVFTTGNGLDAGFAKSVTIPKNILDDTLNPSKDRNDPFPHPFDTDNNTATEEEGIVEEITDPDSGIHLEYREERYRIPKTRYVLNEELYQKWLDWLGQQEGGDIGGNIPEIDPDDILPGHDDIGEIIPGHPGVTVEPIPGTSIDLLIPGTYKELYELWQEYLKWLNAYGSTNVRLTKLTLYSVTNLQVGVIHTYDPYRYYVWKVTGPNGTATETTVSPLLRLLFQREGNYTIQVSNKQDITRNSRASGKATDILYLDDGSPFAGLVLAMQSHSFQSDWLGVDEGPITVQRQISTRNTLITPEMLNRLMFSDSNGNIHSPAEGFTTERN